MLSISRMALSTLSVSSVGVLVMEGVLVCPEEVSLEKVLSDPRPFREVGPDKIAPVAKRANLAGRDYYEANRG